ncbi:pyrophosphate--fructose 6-phosphate 1-phosphotransferase [Musa troglodytarum]|uniref:Pyrophosphate--fructose 6-phosphate 1-phosphotransferase n=1 Tax=Musa troglodytarum TaxID=320322 RepID=A0A9E7GP13_9LILI|nr:pyrophosphate--fructose 6-phosphate 1-phosphotransferase [Musa troglodytarum]
MDSDYGVPRELSDLQKQRALYRPGLPPCLQGTTVRVEFGDATTTSDPAGVTSNTDAAQLAETFAELKCSTKLLLHPESDDSAQLSQIETEKLLAQLVETEMNKRLVRSIVKPGCPQEVLKAALSSMASVTDVLSVMSSSSLNGQTPL